MVSHAQYPGIYVPRCRHFNSEEKPHLSYSTNPTCRTCQKVLAADQKKGATVRPSNVELRQQGLI